LLSELADRLVVRIVAIGIGTASHGARYVNRATMSLMLWISGSARSCLQFDHRGGTVLPHTFGPAPDVRVGRSAGWHQDRF